jgi:hypothetical protein
MLQTLLDTAAQWGVTADKMAIMGVGVGMLVLVFGLVGTFTPEPSLSRRMTLPRDGNSARRNFDLVRAGNENPSGLLKALYAAAIACRAATSFARADVREAIATGLKPALR